MAAIAIDGPSAVVVPLSAFCDVIRVRSDTGMRDLFDEASAWIESGGDSLTSHLMRPQRGLRLAVTLLMRPERGLRDWR